MKTDTRCWRRLAARLRRDKRGGVAIEFSILALPFALITFTILESCISFAAQELLANATDTIAREMRTGQIKPADIDEPRLKERICNEIALLAPSSCLEDVQIDLKQFTSFTEAADEYVYIDKPNIMIMGFEKQPNSAAKSPKPRPPTVGQLGTAGTKNTFRVFYKWPITTGFVADMIGTPLPDDRMLHFASVTWQNEPFDD